MSDDITSGAMVDGGRETAPMSEFRARAVGVGIVVFLIGLLITVAIPLAFTLG